MQMVRLDNAVCACLLLLAALALAGALPRAAAEEQGRCGAGKTRSTCGGADIPTDHMLLQHTAVHQTPPKLQLPADSGVGDFCHTTTHGERCFALADWIMKRDLADNPQRYPGLTAQSTFEEVQAFLHGRGKPFCPPPCGPVSTPPRDYDPSDPGGEPCEPSIIEMDFFNAKPDIDEDHQLWEQPLPMRYRELGHVNGRAFDLLVSSASPLGDVTGGLGNGGSKFGSIIVRGGVSATVRFEFIDSETGQPVVVPKFHFSFFDLDAALSDGWRPAAEEIQVAGFEDYSLAKHTEVRVQELEGGRTRFRATQVGFGCDNPVDPLLLGSVTCAWPTGHTVDQRRRAVTFLFAAKSSFEATLVAEVGGGWRSFMFAGSASLRRACPESPAPAPSPPKEGEPSLGLCAIFGDPHFITFDGGHTVAFGDRVLWLVHSDRVWIQAWSWGSQGRLAAIALGGEFLRGHTVVVYKDKPTSMGVMYDGRQILHKFGSNFSEPGIMDGFYSKEWRADLHNGDILKLRTELKFDIGPWPERFLGEPKGGLVLLRLPGGMELTATGVNYMSAVLTMSAEEGGQTGYCGDFDGNPDNDETLIGPSFNQPVGDDLDSVPEAQNLFKLAGAEEVILGSPLKMEMHEERKLPDPREALSSCDPDLKAKAQRRCINVPDARMRSDCVLDICMTGDLKVADDVIAADILEDKVNTRGIPAFMGLGRCLDSEGRTYSGYAAGGKSEGACAELLRSLPLAKGVVGAQLRKGSSCEILVEADGADPRAFEVPGGWGEPVGSGEGGTGLVSATSGDGIWKCWHLS